jgi:hypothetical protein
MWLSTMIYKIIGTAIKDLGFTAEQIVRMAGQGGGSKNILLIGKYKDDLAKLKISPLRIVNWMVQGKRLGLVKEIDGSRNLTTTHAVNTYGFFAPQNNGQLLPDEQPSNLNEATYKRIIDNLNMNLARDYEADLLTPLFSGLDEALSSGYSN